MVAVGIFLITYQGYQYIDRVVNTASGISALVITFFPCSTTSATHVGILHIPIRLSSIIHKAAAAVFFILLAFNILFLFTKTSGNPTEQKGWRNLAYYTCGFGIVFFMLLQITTSAFAVPGPTTLINETGMLFCFGVAWLIKGEVLMPDKPALPVDKPLEA
jgi:hypothetical protein